MCCRTPNPSKDCIWDKRTLVLPCPELHNSDGSRQVGVGKCLALLLNPARPFHPHFNLTLILTAVRTYMVGDDHGPSYITIDTRGSDVLEVSLGRAARRVTGVARGYLELRGVLH